MVQNKLLINIIEKLNHFKSSLFFILNIYKYQITIKDEQQPLIVVKGSRRAVKRTAKKEDQSMIFLIPELCCLTG